MYVCVNFVKWAVVFVHKGKDLERPISNLDPDCCSHSRESCLNYGRKNYVGGFRERYMRLPDILDVLLIYGRN